MKTRILIINGHMNVGGAEKSLLDILRYIDYTKYEVDLLLLEDLGDYINEVPLEVHVIFKDLTDTYGSVSSSLHRCISKLNWLCFSMRLIMLLEKIVGKRALWLAKNPLFGSTPYDIAVGFRPGICTDLVAYAVDATNKLTWWHHGDMDAMGQLQLTECEKTYGRFNFVVSVSNGCWEMLKRAMPSLSNSLKVVPNMLDVKSVQEKAELFNPYQSLAELRIVTVGRLSPEKHVENAIYAAERLVGQGLKDFSWYIIGDGPEQGKIESLIRDKQLDDFVSMEGRQPNPYPYMKHATLYVHTSYVESQGLTILEAMALGVPCIVTRSLGPEEFIRDGENGILVEQSAEALADAILEVVGTPKRYEQLRDNTHCPSQYCCENIMMKIEELFVS